MNNMCALVTSLVIFLKIFSVLGVEHLLNHKTNDDFMICGSEPCVKKCCPENYILKKRTCVKSNKHNFTLDIFNGTTEVDETLYFNVIHDRSCKGGTNLRLTPAVFPDDVYYLQRNGSLYRPLSENRITNFDRYCMETIHIRNRTEFAPLVCIVEGLIPEPEGVCSYGMIISMPFLLATFIVYALLPDRNLHMKALMFYVIMLMLSYLLLVIIQLSETQFSDGVCKSLGYFCLFFFLVSFFWMNVICVDIWLTFSGLRGFSGSKKDAERKRFYIYCAYALGVPLLHVLIVYIIDSSVKSSQVKPGIGGGQCFLTKGYPELLYFYGPIAILITINITLFAITAFKIRSIKKETSMLKKEDSKRHSYEDDKQTFNLYVKLLFAMGVNWSMEIISWAVLLWEGSKLEAMWYLTDFCNAIYGVFIFFIFVFKRSIWKMLKKRYYSFIGKPHLAHSMTMTNTTRVTSYSTATSSMHDNPHGVNDTSTLTSEA